MPRTAYPWIAVFVALLACSIVRAQDAATVAGWLGFVVGGTVGPLVFPAVIWMVLQWVIRREPAPVPIWVGVVAVGIGTLGAAAYVGDWAERDDAGARASMTCVPESELYGTPPAGFEFRHLEGQEAKEAIEAINLQDAGVGRIDVVAAEGPGEDDIAILSSFRRTDARDDLDLFIKGAKQTTGYVTREGDIAWIVTDGGGSNATAVKGCHFVMVVGDAEPVVRKLAPAVLEQ